MKLTEKTRREEVGVGRDQKDRIQVEKTWVLTETTEIK